MSNRYNFSRLKELYPDNWDFIAKQYKRKCEYTCEECGKNLKFNPRWLHVHHKIPLSQGGTSDDSNLQCLCYDCHRKKHKHMGNNNYKSVNYSKPFE